MPIHLNTRDWLFNLECRVRKLEDDNEAAKLREWNASMSGKMDMPYPGNPTMKPETEQEEIARCLHEQQKAVRWYDKYGPLPNK